MKLRGWRLLTILMGVCVCASCTTRLTKEASQVLIADDRMVDHCKLLGLVSGSSGWGNLAASAGQINARNEAQERAARMGATHIVWIAVEGGYSPSASARAYDCDVPDRLSLPSEDLTDVEKKLQALKRAFDGGLITQDEYDKKRRELLDEL